MDDISDISIGGFSGSSDCTNSKADEDENIWINGTNSLYADDVYRLAHGTAKIHICPSLEGHSAALRKNLNKAVSEDRAIYGLTSGFGPLVKFATDKDDAPVVQRNLIYHLATGVGDLLTYHEARALMIARLNVITRLSSAVSSIAVEGLAAAINSGLAPSIPSKGTVGASGDLTPSAHLVLCLLGEAPWIDAEGKTVSTSDAQKKFGLSPLALEGRDCLALVNGTSCMTGLASLTLVEIQRLVKKAIGSAAAVADLYGARIEAYDLLLASVRPHPGQIRATQSLQDHLAGSKRMKPYAARQKRTEIEGSFQDPYSIRCLPQAFGAVLDLIDAADRFISTELNSVTDNPVITAGDPAAVHGGNFYGQHVAFAGDMLGAACTKIALILERQIDLMCDPHRNGGQSPFLCKNTPGQHSGLMGAQVTASALLAEMRTQNSWASLQSVPTNGHNQDINTMGTTAVRLARRNMKDLSRILAIHAITTAEYFESVAPGDDDAPSRKTADWYEKVRKSVAALDEDRPLSGDIEKLALQLRDFAS